MFKLKTSLVAAAVGMSLTLTACNDDSTNYDFTGTAIDGYLQNAKITAVCGEQTFEKITGSNGKAGFVTGGIGISDCELTVTSTDSTVDVETGTTYQENELYLTAPKGFDVASPFTTYVVIKLKAAGFSTDDTAAIASVSADVATELGVDVDLLGTDYVAASSSSTAARKASLKAVAVTTILPKTATEFDDTVADSTKLGTKVAAVIAKVTEVIEAAENAGTDLNNLKLKDITVTENEDGSISVEIETEVVTDGTGGTGTGSGSGADGSYVGTGA